MAKEKKQDSGWQFPKALEIVKCKEGNKEFMKERPARRPFGNTVLICEYPLDGDAMQEQYSLNVDPATGEIVEGESEVADNE